MASLGTLSVDLVAKSGGFDKNMKRAQKRTETFDRKMRRFSRNTQRHFGNVVQSVKRLATGLVALGAAAGASISKLSGMVENLTDVARQTGATAGEIQVLHRAASVAGTSINDLDSTLARYTKRVGKAAQDTGPALAALEDLGLSAEELVSKDITEQLEILFERLNALEDPARRAANMDRIFGDSWKQMLPFLEAGAQGIQRAKQRIEELGGALTTDGANKTAEMRLEFRRLSSDIKTVLLKAVVDLSPKIKELADYFSDVITHASKTGKIESFFDAIQGKIDDTRDRLDKLAKLGSNALIAKLFGLTTAGVAATAQIGGSSSDMARRLRRGQPTEEDLGNLPTQRLSGLRELYEKRARASTQRATQYPLGTDMNEAAQKAADKYWRAAQMIDRAMGKGPLRINIDSSSGSDDADEDSDSGSGDGSGSGSGSGSVRTSTNAASAAMTEAERQHLQAMQNSQAKYREWLDLQAQRKQSINGLIQQFGTREQAAQAWYQSQVERIRSLAGESKLANELIAGAHRQMVERVNAGTQEMSAFARRAKENIQDQLGRTLQNVLAGNFEGIKESWAAMLRQMAAQAAASRLNEALFGGGSSGDSGGLLGKVGGMLAGAVGSYFGGPSSASVGQSFADAGIGGMSFGAPSIGGLANGGPAGPGSIHEVAERGPEMLNSGGRSYLLMGKEGGHVSPVTSGAVAATNDAASAKPMTMNLHLDFGGGKKERQQLRGRPEADGSITFKAMVKSAIAEMSRTGEMEEALGSLAPRRQSTI